jgi:glycosyltransferase involved in cell wall biosynthesis
MKKVLIITYYWPPSGGGGVHRWLKFTKYLRSFGWEPIILTASENEIPVKDNSLLQEIPENIKTHRVPIWEPYSLYKALVGKNKKSKIYSGFIEENKSRAWSQKLAIYIRSNFFIPDARMFWIRPVVKYLVNYLKNNHVDVIVSTGPPHTTHLIGQKIHRKTKIPWVADFRDPWTDIDYYEQLNLSKWADRKHKRLEKEVLLSASRIVAISNSMREDFITSSERKDVLLINNGYDPSDFKEPAEKMDSRFSIIHLGSMNKDRNPEILWKALSELSKNNPEFNDHLQIKLIGNVDYSILESLENYNLSKFLKKEEYLPHNVAIEEMRSSQILLLPINNTKNSKGILPGKFYEYMAAKRPILAIGPLDSDCAELLKETGSGEIFDYNDFNGLKNQVMSWFLQYQKNQLSIKPKGVDEYSRKNLVGKYAKVFNELIK